VGTGVCISKLKEDGFVCLGEGFKISRNGRGCCTSPERLLLSHGGAVPAVRHVRASTSTNTNEQSPSGVYQRLTKPNSLQLTLTTAFSCLFRCVPMNSCFIMIIRPETQFLTRGMTCYRARWPRFTLTSHITRGGAIVINETSQSSNLSSSPGPWPHSSSPNRSINYQKRCRR
jgi:hypothetical protein